MQRKGQGASTHLQMTTPLNLHEFTNPETLRTLSLWFVMEVPLHTCVVLICLPLVCVCVCVSIHSVAQSYLTLGDPMDCSLPGSSVHGIGPTRIPEWVATSSSRASSRPRD